MPFYSLLVSAFKLLFRFLFLSKNRNHYGLFTLKFSTSATPDRASSNTKGAT